MWNIYQARFDAIKEQSLPLLIELQSLDTTLLSPEQKDIHEHLLSSLHDISTTTLRVPSLGQMTHNELSHSYEKLVYT